MFVVPANSETRQEENDFVTYDFALSQVVKEDGKEDAWRVVYQKENQPDADTLEIPDLTPFTQYR